MEDRPKELYAALEQLIAQYIMSHPDETGLPDIHKLIHWAHTQALGPPENSNEFIDWMRRNI